MTLETADLLAIAGIVFGSMLAVVGGALAWLRADIAALNDSLRATGAKVDALIQVILAGALAQDSKANSPRTDRAGPAQLGALLSELSDDAAQRRLSNPSLVLDTAA